MLATSLVYEVAQPWLLGAEEHCYHAGCAGEVEGAVQGAYCVPGPAGLHARQACTGGEGGVSAGLFYPYPHIALAFLYIPP